MKAATPILMPKLGLTMTEGLLASWNVKAGDEVRRGDVLFVVESEKIATEVEAHGDGRIHSIEVGQGDTVPVGAVVATWTGPGHAAVISEVAEEAEAAAPVNHVDTVRPWEPSPGRLAATPLARRVAHQNGIELSRIRGSGPRGRIKEVDVKAALASEAGQDHAQASIILTNRAERRRPATQVEKVIARRLTAAKQTIPHFYLLAEADVTFLLTLREEINSDRTATRTTLNHFVVAAVGRALAEIPEMKAVWDNDEVVLHRETDVGIVVDTQRGLVVPVLREVGSMPLDAIVAAASTLVEQARENRLAPADFEGGVISVSNVGMHGTSFLVPIINPGQAAILGVGAVKPVFRPNASGAPQLRQELGLVLSCDHRVLDGVRAALFLNRIVQLLQQPLRLLRA